MAHLAGTLLGLDIHRLEDNSLVLLVLFLIVVVRALELPRLTLSDMGTVITHHQKAHDTSGLISTGNTRRRLPAFRPVTRSRLLGASGD